MRVDPFFISRMVGALDQTQSTEQKLTNELSSGVRVNSLGDDPVAAGENVLLLNQMQMDDSFTQSSNLVQGQLQVADSALGSAISQVTQAISLATEANNGTLNSSQLQAISNQLGGIRDELTSLANSSYQGQYIFAGSLTSTAPFATSTGTTPATTNYNGDENVNHLLTPNGQTIQLNVPGDQVFLTTGPNSAFQALNNLIAAYSGGSMATVNQDTQALTSALNHISQQRVILDDSVNQLTAASDAITNEQTQLKAAQSSLMQADLPQISTQLSLAETQQAALEAVISQLGAGSLFDKLR